MYILSIKSLALLSIYSARSSIGTNNMLCFVELSVKSWRHWTNTVRKFSEILKDGIYLFLIITEMGKGTLSVNFQTHFHEYLLFVITNVKLGGLSVKWTFTHSACSQILLMFPWWWWWTNKKTPLAYIGPWRVLLFHSLDTILLGIYRIWNSSCMILGFF